MVLGGVGFNRTHDATLSISEKLALPFLPFTNTLWTVMLAAIAVHICVYYCVEGGFERVTVHRTLTGDRIRKARRLKHVRAVGQEVGTVLRSIQATDQTPETDAGFCMKFGLAFFLFFAINLWASGLTTSLVTNAVLTNRVKDLKEACDRQYRICAAGDLGAALKNGALGPAAYAQWNSNVLKEQVLVPEPWGGSPTPTWKGQPGNVFGMFKAIEEETCEVGLAPESTFQYGLQMQQEAGCDFALIGSTFINPVPIGMPVSLRFEPFVSTLAIQYVDSGNWVKEVKKGDPHPDRQLKCSVHLENRVSKPLKPSTRLETLDMLVPFMVLGLCTLAGLVQIFVMMMPHQHTRRPSERPSKAPQQTSMTASRDDADDVAPRTPDVLVTPAGATITYSQMHALKAQMEALKSMVDAMGDAVPPDAELSNSILTTVQPYAAAYDFLAKADGMSMQYDVKAAQPWI